MKKRKWLLWMVSALLLMVSTASQAGKWSIGTSILMQSTPYKGVKTKDYITPLPVINYEGESLYFHTLTAGYYVWKEAKNTLSLDANYAPQFFNPKENDDADMRQLNHHRNTVMSGATYQHNENWGILRASMFTDILGISHGSRVDTAYLYPFTSNYWWLKSGIGLTWNSKKQTRYEYGVTRKESQDSGLADYQPGDNWTPYVELSGQYRFNERWAMFALARVEHVPSDIQDSPMVNKSVSSLVWTGLTYTF